MINPSFQAKSSRNASRKAEAGLSNLAALREATATRSFNLLAIRRGIATGFFVFAALCSG